MKLLRSEVENKKVLVFGSGISGIGAVKLLEALEAQVVLYDGNEKLQEEQIRKQLGTGSVCSIVLGELPKELISTLDLVVMSPGVPLDIPAVEQLRTAEFPFGARWNWHIRWEQERCLPLQGPMEKPQPQPCWVRL